MLLGPVIQNWWICSEYHLKSFSALYACIGPKYWLGQLNLGGIIAHIILFRMTWQFVYEVIALVGLCLTQKIA